MSRLKPFRRILIVAATCACLGIAGPAFADDAASAHEPFSLSLPAGYGAFTQQVQTAKSPEGDIVTTNWIAKAPTGEAVVVTMSSMPAKILDPQKFIASTRASLLKSLNATLESESAREGAVPSTRLLFRSDSAFFRARFTVIDDRFYQLLYIGRSEEQRTAQPVARIFESFTIADAPRS